MKTANDLRNAAFVALAGVREYRANEQTKQMVVMLDALIEHYQVRLIDCPDAEVSRLRVSAQQLVLLRTALTAADLNRVALTA